MGILTEKPIFYGENIKVKIKVKFTLEQTTKVHWGSRGIALLFLSLGAGWCLCSTPRPGHFTLGKYPVPIV
jgi:hypothetical protein